MITAVQQDYLETVYRLESELGRGQVRVSDIAESLGTRLPTVTRTVQRLTLLGYFTHAARGRVGLSTHGRKLAGQMVHIHADLVHFFTEILGLSESQAEADACRLEHGFSPESAQRLHEFIEYLTERREAGDPFLARFAETIGAGGREFTKLIDNRVDGWRA